MQNTKLVGDVLALPLTYDDTNAPGIWGSDVILGCLALDVVNGREKAAAIVTACNNHDRLMRERNELVNMVVRFLDDREHAGARALDASAMLARIEGEGE